MSIRKTILAGILFTALLGSAPSTLAQEVVSDTTVNKHTIRKLVHWVSVFTMYSDLELSDKVDLAEYAEAADIAAGFISNPELSVELAKFRAATFVNVYPKGMMGGNQWITTKLNEVSDAQYSTLNAPYLSLEVWFTPVSDNSGYLTTVVLKPSEAIRETISAVQTQINASLIGKKFSSPGEAKETVNNAIFGGLAQLQTLLGLTYAPNIAIRFEDKLYLSEQTIETWQRTDGLARLEAVDRNGNLLSGNLTWTGVRGSGSAVDFLVNESRTDYVALRSGADQIRVTIRVKEFTLDINELLKRLIIEALSAKKKKATDTLVHLRQDSINNARNVGQLIATLEKDNFPMERIGSSFTPLFADPVTLADSSEFQNNSDKANSLREIKKRKRLERAIRRQFNIEAFADLVAKNPNKLKVVLDDLLRNSGELIANLILGQDGQGQENIARNIVVDYINKNMQRYVDANTADSSIPEQPLPVAQVTVTPQTFDPAKHVYMSPHVQFEGRAAFIQQLEDSLKNQSPPLYAFVNYSQDVSTESFLARDGGVKPLGLPEGARYATITLVNIPGSVKYQLFHGSSSSTLTAFSPREGVKENILVGLFGDDDEALVVYAEIPDGYIPECGMNGKPPIVETIIFYSQNCSSLYEGLVTNYIKKGYGAYLCASERFNVIKCLANGLISGYKEEAIIKLITGTPSVHTAALLEYLKQDNSGLLKKINGGFQFGNYVAVFKAIQQMYLIGISKATIDAEVEKIDNTFLSDKPRAEKAQQNYFTWFEGGVLKAMFADNFIFSRFDAVSIADDGAVSFRYATDPRQTGETTTPISIKPFALVGIRIRGNTNEVLEAGNGNIVYVPGIMLPLLISKKEVAEFFEALNATAVATGVGSIVVGATRFVIVSGGIDILLGGSALVVDNYKDDILKMQHGEAFLDVYVLLNKAFLIYFGSRTILQLTQVLPRLSTTFSTFKNSDDFVKLKTTNPSKASQIEKEIDDLIKESNEVLASARASALLQKIQYGSEELSRIVQNFRKTTGKKTGNVAMIEYVDNSGTSKYQIGESTGIYNPHAEKAAWLKLESLGVKPEQVTRIYTELEPCASRGRYCKNFITRTFPNAKTSYSFDYLNGTTESCKASVKTLGEQVNLLFK